METLIAVFLLACAEKDEKLKEALKQTLAFYKENRELLLALAGKQPPAAAASAASEEADGEKAPSVSGEGVRILDEFLKKL